MSSRGKKKTTMAKLSRESKLRERRLEKQAKKNARRQQALAHPGAAIHEPGSVTFGPHQDRAGESPQRLPPATAGADPPA